MSFAQKVAQTLPLIGGKRQKKIKQRLRHFEDSERIENSNHLALGIAYKISKTALLQASGASFEFRWREFGIEKIWFRGHGRSSPDGEKWFKICWSNFW